MRSQDILSLDGFGCVLFEVAEAYEVMMGAGAGRWSRPLAPLFVELVDVRDGEKALNEDPGTIVNPHMLGNHLKLTLAR